MPFNTPRFGLGHAAMQWDVPRSAVVRWHAAPGFRFVAAPRRSTLGFVRTAPFGAETYYGQRGGLTECRFQ